MLLLGVNIYSPAGFVNVSSGIGTNLSLISYILLPVRTLNVVLSPPINILSLSYVLRVNHTKRLPNTKRTKVFKIV